MTNSKHEMKIGSLWKSKFDNDDKQLLTNALNQILGDENRWRYKWVADDFTTFKFKDVLNEE